MSQDSSGVDPYERFIDADRNRIAWVAIFKRADAALRELDGIAPKLAERLRERFYEEAAQPLLSARAGEEALAYIEANVGELWPLTWDEAVRCAEETGRSAFEIAEEHRRWALAQE
jgi:hypothetical protein